MPKLQKITCIAYDGSPNNVRLADAWAPIVTTIPVSRRVFLINAPRTVPTPANVLAGVQYGNDGTEFTGSLSAGSAVFPDENDVDVTAPAYGPTGAEYTGDLVQPAVGDVKSGVQYGADGTEFTGTYSAGGGTPGGGRTIEIGGSPVQVYSGGG